MLQEARNCVNKEGKKIDSVTPIKNFLQNMYHVELTPYHPDIQAFQYVIAFKKAKFDFTNHTIKYFTKTPDESTLSLREKSVSDTKIRFHNLGTFWETSTAITHMTDKDTGQEICVFNVHMSMILY